MHNLKKYLLIFVFCLAYRFGFSQSWKEEISETTNDLTSIFFIDNNNGYASGANGIILKTINGGKSWSNTFWEGGGSLLDIYFKDINIGFIVGRNGTVLKTTNSGTIWNRKVSLINTDLIRVCNNGNDIYITGYNGVILKSVDFGDVWTTLFTGTSQSLYGICFTDTNTGYAVGNGGTIIKTINGGNSWTPLITNTTMQLLSVCFTDANNGYVVGGNGSTNTAIILKTTNAGVTWTQQIYSDNYFGSIRFINSSKGFIAGGSITANTSTILKTVDGGDSWIVQPVNSKRQFGLCFPSIDVAYSCGLDGTILKTQKDVLEADAGMTQYNCIGSSLLIGGELTASGGVPPYSYSWSPSVGLSSTIVSNPTCSAISTTTYTVTVIDAASNTTEASVKVNVFPLPNANAGLDQTVLLGSTVSFKGSGGVVGDSYRWNFGDGTTSFLQDPIHLYNNTGSYNVTVSVIDNNGCIATDNQLITVLCGCKKLHFYLPDKLCVGEKITFENASVSCYGDPRFVWDFGDGSQPSSNPDHIYVKEGKYEAKLIIPQFGNCSEKLVSTTISVVECPEFDCNAKPPCNVNGTIVSTIGPTNATHNIEVTSGAAPFQYLWSITSRSEFIGQGTNTISTLDQGTVTVVITDSKGCTVTVNSGQ